MKPTDKQIKYAWFLMKSTQLPLPGNWKEDVRICGAYIKWAKGKTTSQVDRYVARTETFSEYSDEHTKRILSGGPLKNDPGPWDEEWCLEQERNGTHWW